MPPDDGREVGVKTRIYWDLLGPHPRGDGALSWTHDCVL